MTEGVMLCPNHLTPLTYVAYPDENMVGERVCDLCEAGEPTQSCPECRVIPCYCETVVEIPITTDEAFDEPRQGGPHFAAGVDGDNGVRLEKHRREAPDDEWRRKYGPVEPPGSGENP